MTPRQLAILRAHGGWLLADILIDPDHGIAHAKQSCYGCTSFRVEGEEFCMETTARGIELYQWDADSARQNYYVLRWSQVARFARALPARMVADLRACRQELTRSAASHPEYPVGSSDEERQRWQRAAYRPWLARKRANQARRDAALDAAVLAGADPQPVLFDLGTTLRQAGTRRSSQPLTHIGQERLL